MSPKDDDKHIPITIDKKPYKATKDEMTGAEIRALPDPDVATERDLWLEMHGNQDDIPVGLSTVIDLKPGMHFYTAPSTINPG